MYEGLPTITVQADPVGHILNPVVLQKFLNPVNDFAISFTGYEEMRTNTNVPCTELLFAIFFAFNNRPSTVFNIIIETLNAVHQYRCTIDYERPCRLTLHFMSVS